MRAILPWLIAAAALTFYGMTLNHWVSFNNLGRGNLGQVARTSGWTWQPDVYGPVNWLLTYPFRWLPLKSIPLALNLFAGLCAALTLALLARSVALLPHDRTDEQRKREEGEFSLLSIRSAWLPPLMAAIVCGLQLTFWENATVFTTGMTSAATPASWGAGAEMLDLLLFAFVIRCLLEFRINERESWLARAAFVYGAAITNNWAMIGFFPLFLAALVWIKGLDFFNARFLTRMFLWGLAGLSLYLLMPIAQSAADIGSIPFWAALKANLGSQKVILGQLIRVFRQAHQDALLLAVTSLLPILVISIRWASYFGDTSRLGIALTTAIFHLVHGVFLVVCIWVALDPPFSPRFSPLGHDPGAAFPFLTLSYLGALSIGYFSGYFLLIFGRRPDSSERQPLYLRIINSVIVSLVWLLFLLAPAALIYRNLPQIRVTNGSSLKHYASLMKQALVPGAVILSDDPRRLFMMQSLAAQNGKNNDCLFLDTTSLPFPEYHRFLKKKYPQRWQNVPKERNQLVDTGTLLQILTNFAKSNRVYYLHPSFGYYFEVFWAEPHGLIYKLNFYPTNTLIAPLLTKEMIQENEMFWTRAEETALAPLVRAIEPPSPAARATLSFRLMQHAHLKTEPNRTVGVLAEFYSRALDYWGVEMQRQGELPSAAAHFERALELNPDNIVAELNLECNRNLQAGRKSGIQLTRPVEDQFGKYRNWDQIMGLNGPFDEPNACYEQGRIFVPNGLYRQAAYQFDRAKTLAPDNLSARLWLAQLYILSQMSERALKLIEEIHEQPNLLKITRTNQNEMLFIEASAHLAAHDLPGAQATVSSVLNEYPADEGLLSTATQVYMNYSYYSNALTVIDKQLQLDPNNLSALVNKGFSALQINAFDQAIPPLTRVLTIQSNYYPALLNRAIAYLRSDKLDAARHDYEVLQKALPTEYRIYYGLGEIAYRKRETNAAIRNYQLYLTNNPPDTEEAKSISARLKELKLGSR
ncbi:MAG: hypothetical protein QOJ40_2643 [Verrucomicrobiota bacterium]